MMLTMGGGFLGVIASRTCIMVSRGGKEKWEGLFVGG